MSRVIAAIAPPMIPAISPISGAERSADVVGALSAEDVVFDEVEVDESDEENGLVTESCVVETAVEVDGALPGRDGDLCTDAEVCNGFELELRELVETVIGA